MDAARIPANPRSRRPSDRLLIRDQSEALRALAKKAGLQLDVSNLAAESKLRTERAIGDALAGMKKNGERPAGRPKESHGATLSSLGIHRDESSRWQKLASVPEPVFQSN